MAKSKKRYQLRSVWLDYRGARDRKALVANLSAAAFQNGVLWTASDEGRTIECLKPHSGGFQLHRQVHLDDIFSALPGGKDEAEADLESLDIADGCLWICGSHCRVRRQAQKTGSNRVDSRLLLRRSRSLLGFASLASRGDNLVRPGTALPYKGRGSLRRTLSRNPFVGPFVDLPSKENGLDIEGMTVLGKAVARTPQSARGQRRPGCRTRYGIRPPKQGRSEFIQHPRLLFQWPAGSPDRPEGLCSLGAGKLNSFLVVYDTDTSPGRVKGTRVRADILSAR